MQKVAFVLEGHAGGISGTVLERKKIEDHRYKSFVFPNHGNKQDTLFNNLLLR